MKPVVVESEFLVALDCFHWGAWGFVLPARFAYTSQIFTQKRIEVHLIWPGEERKPLEVLRAR